MRGEDDVADVGRGDFFLVVEIANDFPNQPLEPAGIFELTEAGIGWFFGPCGTMRIALRPLAITCRGSWYLSITFST